MNVAELDFAQDLGRILKEETTQAVPLDLWYCYRLFLLRRPEFSDPERFVARTSVEDVRGLVAGFVKSEEFQRLWKTVGMQLPDVPVMVITPEGTRIWFSLADSDVGWRVAADVYEPDVTRLIKQSVGWFSMLRHRCEYRLLQSPYGQSGCNRPCIRTASKEL